MHPSSRHKLTRRLAILFLLSIAASFLIAHQRERDLSLLGRARFVRGLPVDGMYQYWWISDENILFLREVSSNQMPYFVLYNWRTGVEKPVATLNRLFAQLFAREGINQYSLGAFNVSPNGRWIYCEHVDRGKRFSYVVDFNGIVIGRWQHTSVDVAWSGDSKELIERYTAHGMDVSHLSIRSINNLSRVINISLSNSSPLKRMNLMEPSQVGAGHRLVICTRDLDGAVMVPDDEDLELETLDLDRGGIIVGQHKIQLPEIDYLDSPLAYSMNGDHVAWQAYYDSSPAWMRILRRSFPTTKLPIRWETSLWVAGTADTSPYEIGAVDIVSPDHFNKFNDISDVRWLADCKHVSFIYQHRIYIANY